MWRHCAAAAKDEHEQPRVHDISQNYNELQPSSSKIMIGVKSLLLNSGLMDISS